MEDLSVCERRGELRAIARRFEARFDISGRFEDRVELVARRRRLFQPCSRAFSLVPKIVPRIAGDDKAVGPPRGCCQDCYTRAVILATVSLIELHPIRSQPETNWKISNSQSSVSPTSGFPKNNQVLSATRIALRLRLNSRGRSESGRQVPVPLGGRDPAQCLIQRSTASGVGPSLECFRRTDASAPEISPGIKNFFAKTSFTQRLPLYRAEPFF